MKSKEAYNTAFHLTLRSRYLRIGKTMNNSLNCYNLPITTGNKTLCGITELWDRKDPFDGVFGINLERAGRVILAYSVLVGAYLFLSTAGFCCCFGCCCAGYGFGNLASTIIIITKFNAKESSIFRCLDKCSKLFGYLYQRFDVYSMGFSYFYPCILFGFNFKLYMDLSQSGALLYDPIFQNKNVTRGIVIGSFLGFFIRYVGWCILFFF